MGTSSTVFSVRRKLEARIRHRGGRPRRWTSEFSARWERTRETDSADRSRWVGKEARPISLRQLMVFGRSLTEARLVSSANYVRTELPTRYHPVPGLLAKRENG